PFSSAGSAGSALYDAGFGLLGQPGGPEDGVGVNILPDNVSIRRDLEDAPRSPLADQRVAVWQPLRATDAVAVEGARRCTAVLPGDSIGLGVHLKNSGVIDAPSVGAIVEEEYATAFWEVGGMMLVRDLARPPLPCEATAGLVHNADHARCPFRKSYASIFW